MFTFLAAVWLLMVIAIVSRASWYEFTRYFLHFSMSEAFVHQHEVVITTTSFFNIIQDIYFNLCTLIVSFYCPYHFYCVNVLVSLTFECTSKCSITQVTRNFVSTNFLSDIILEMSCILIVSGVGR